VFVPCVELLKQDNCFLDIRSIYEATKKNENYSISNN